jgi:lipopolysaccharide assembly outer membrane protein LptD (OstA)
MTRFHSLLFFICVGSARAQTVPPDTTRAIASVQDSTKRGASAGIDTVVNYSAKDSIIYSLRTRYMNLYGKSEMQYQTIGLKAERVNVNWDNATLIALGVKDTVKADSVIGKPIMRDGGEEYKGDQVKYNFHTRKGKISIGNTQMDNGYYVGDQIKKVDPDVLCVSDGIYTTCDLKDPHFYFASPKMKVYVRDKVVAEPIFLYVADVPVFALPFGVFPAHGGRSSGLIAPAYGDDNRFGWYLSHLGYYWAASDYWDIGSMFDIYSRGRWQNQTTIRYALRYNFGGSITARITSSPEGEPSDPNYSKTRDYYFNITHGQKISPSSDLKVNFTFMNGNYFKNNSFNISEILQQNMES